MFALNTSAKYPVGAQYKEKSFDLINHIIYINKDEKFGVKMINIFNDYRLKMNNSEVVRLRWHNEPMRIWQNQLNYAMWCATAGCGVPLEVKTNNYMVNAFYKFHIYYTIRRILRELNVPLPNDDAFDPVDNTYNKNSYEMLCNEFKVSVNEKWHINGPNDGFGENYMYDKNHNPYLIPLKCYRYGWDPAHQSYSEPDQTTVIHIVYTLQTPDVNPSQFLLDESVGFTIAGIGRINDSIRTFVWAILTAQSEIRSSQFNLASIHKQFVENVENAIISPINISESIARYQKSIENANSSLTMSLGKGLYLIPGDLSLNISKKVGYNNYIMYSTFSEPGYISTPITEHVSTLTPTPTEQVPTKQVSTHENTYIYVGIAGVLLILVNYYNFTKY